MNNLLPDCLTPHYQYQYPDHSDVARVAYCLCAYELMNRDRVGNKHIKRSNEDSLWDCLRGLSASVACYPAITLDIKHGLDINILSITFFIIVIQGWPLRVLPF